MILVQNRHEIRNDFAPESRVDGGEGQQEVLEEQLLVDVTTECHTGITNLFDRTHIRISLVMNSFFGRLLQCFAVHQGEHAESRTKFISLIST